MGMASASSDLDDHNDTLTVSNEIEIVDDNSENLDNGNAEILGVSSQGNDILGTDRTYSGTTLSGLVTAVSSASNGDTIILQNNILADGNDKKFSKSITIDGNGHTIDANGKYYIFNQNSAGHFIFKNIKFTNSSLGRDDGVLKLWYQATYEFINCTFDTTSPINFIRVLDSKVVNCTFKNCVGGYGGAIRIQSNCNNISVINCTFINCSASSGAVVYYGYNIVNSFVDNCTFINNTGYDGCICKGLIGNVTNCTFENNNATGDTVVYLNGNVDNCTFIGNAEYGHGGTNNVGIVYITKTGNITNSKFFNNTADYGIIHLHGDNHYVINCTTENNTGNDIFHTSSNYYSYIYNNTLKSANAPIYNQAKMYLENNTVNSYIINDALIFSKTHLVVMNNQTVIGTKGYGMTFNGTITDDMNNTIICGSELIGAWGHCKYNFIITDPDGSTTTKSITGQVEGSYNDESGVFYTDSYTLNSAGAYTVTPTFTNYGTRPTGFTNTEPYTGVVLVQSALTMTVTHNDTIYVGENATVRVTLSDDSARGNITITVGNQNKTFVLNDDVYGTVEWNISGLPEGTYPVIVNYTGDNIFSPQNYEGDLVVKNYDTIILITPEHGTYHQVVNATATLYYAKGSTIVGMIDDNLTVIINNKQYNVRSGEKIQVTDDLAVNAYEVVGIYNGGDRYKAAYNNTNLYVTKATPIVEIEVLTEPSEDRLGVRVRVNDTATGFVALKINDEVIDILSLKSVDEYGYLTKFIENINAGNFNIEAEYLGDENYTNASNKTSFSNIRGTYTDLQRLIDANTNLDLTYDFIYTPAIDGDKFPNGVNITKTITINGNNHTISGNNTLAVFYVNGTGVHLDNITFINAKAESTVFWNNTLGYISNSTFKDNNVTYDIYNNQTLFFENNTLENFIYNDGEILSKTNIIVLNNQTITRTQGTNVNLNAIIKDDNNNTIVSKTKLQFILLRNVKNIIH